MRRLLLQTFPRSSFLRSVMLALGVVIGGLALPATLQAQTPTLAPPGADSATVTVRVTAADRPVEAAVVRSGMGRDAAGTQTNAQGLATLRLGAGERRLVASKIGYHADSVTLTLRAGADTIVALEMHDVSAAAGVQGEKDEKGMKGESPAELTGVVVTATRSQRRVEAEPTRVDVLDHEEVEEHTAMSPGNVAAFLSETGGVRVQTTSPGLGGANLRVQGLRGRYTQILSDGLPLYGLTTEGLGLLQIPPIDLRQIELIKGAASALYGPSALGGVVNFVSRRPPMLIDDRAHHALELYANQTTLDGSDLALFDARALSSQWGYTLLASGNRQDRRDLSGEGWANVPGYQRGVVRPRLFWNGRNGSDVFVTAGFTAENRSGGTIAGGQVPTGGSFAVARNTRRGDVGTVAHLVLGRGRVLAVRGSATQEWRRTTVGRAPSSDRRATLFSEAALVTPAGTTHEFVLGAAVQRDGYVPRDVPALAYTFTVPALFAQDTWTPADWFGLTSSARLDAHSHYGTTVSPRLSALLRPWTTGPLRGWTARVSSGAGSYGPTPFVEEMEEIDLRQLRPITTLYEERSWSGSADVGGLIGPLELNAAVYASKIEHPVGLRAIQELASGVSVELVNATSPTRTSGAQLFARYHAGPYRVTGFYDFQRATEEDVERGVPAQRREVPLTPRHVAGLVGLWETEDDAGLSVEAFYTGRQALADNPYRTESRPYLLVGALARMRVGKAVLYVNGENLGNVRQTHVDPLLRRTPGIGGRWTTDAWAPLDGAVVNAGVRLGF